VVAFREESFKSVGILSTDVDREIDNQGEEFSGGFFYEYPS